MDGQGNFCIKIGKNGDRRLPKLTAAKAAKKWGKVQKCKKFF
jgi:hypothetical protein